MSVLFAGEHFFRKNNRIFVSNNGKKLLNKRLTGTKISKFFKQPEINSSFDVGKEVFGISISPSNILEQERIHNLEQIAIKKLKDQIGDGGKTYPINTINVFGEFEDDETMGGVPDGEKIEGDKVVSIIEMSFSSKNIDGNTPNGTKVLQLSFYLFLRNIEVGYIFECPTHKSQKDLILSKDVIKRSFSGSQTIQKDSEADGVENINFEYEILDSGEGPLESGTHQCNLYKIKISRDKCAEIFKSMCAGIGAHQDQSPMLSSSEGSNVLAKDFMGDRRQSGSLDQ